MLERGSRQSEIAAIKQFTVASVMLFLQAIVFFLSAGNFASPRLWLYFVMALGHYCVSTVVQYKLNPQLIVQRLKRKREGSKLWDEILSRVSNLMVIVWIPVAAGLDSRFNWSSLDSLFVVLGFVFITTSTFLLNWAMTVNPHFEPTVRLQKDRGHKVITVGPYKVVRHPGYLAGILFAISIPLIVGSLVALLAVGIYVFLIVIRTWLEDKTLQKELEGYLEYISQTRYRLIPGAW